MSARDWLATREPAPPPRLAERMHELLRDADPAAEPADALVGAASRVLDRLLREGETRRDSALELLAVDALATYAFEAASGNPSQFEARCLRGMRRFSEIAELA